jgi:NAD(P)-dependent dehydrogenase (short-subunit alcohol dehydrogenase family)
LITGANRGLGLEFARQYAAAGYRVFATARDPSATSELKQLTQARGKLSIHQLDVARPDTITALARELAGEPIDILLNNAGVQGGRRQSFGDIDYDAWEQALRINVFGPMRVCEAFIDNVAKSERKLLVAISSGMGSISDSSGGSYIYRTSKAALNMVMHNLALDLRPRGILSVVINPGWVQTDMGGRSAPTSPEDSIRAMRQVFDRLTPDDSGKFLNYRGGGYDW